ncbi:MAG: ribose 5-phosphate isomerase B [Anaerolinea sp.]|nr:ribose 5-phosphate isomerase B [Anaerolinea sp.]
MRVAIGTDHAGLILKKYVVDAVQSLGHEILDVGVYGDEKVDYPDYAEKVGAAISSKSAERGILICGSGVGVCITANKMTGVYAAICHDTYSAHQGVEHDGMNVLCLGGRVIGPEPAMEIVVAFLNAEFIEDERFIRRFNKIKAIEAKRSSSHE